MSSRADRAALRPLAEAVLLHELPGTSVSRLCPRCGSAEHGRPVVRGVAGGRVWVSLAYAPGLAVVAWCTEGPCGVDVEPGTPDDPAPLGAVDLAGWTRAEAVAKATGTGLDAGLTADPGPLARVQPLALPPGYVGHLAVLGRDTAAVSWRAAGPAATPRAARG